MMAELQRANVSGDRPAIFRFDAGGVGIHDAIAVRDHVVEMANRRVAQTIDLKRWWLRKTAPHYHPVAAAGPIMSSPAHRIVPSRATPQKCRLQLTRQLRDVRSFR